MNYLGHAWVALARSGEPAFVLGAMLPDFATMARTRLSSQAHEEVGRGVDLHLWTDSVFHDDRGFLRLVTDVTSALSSRGVGRGTARAVGHIGVELLLDGELLEHASLRAAYIDALNVAPGLPLGFRDADGAKRVELLLGRLLQHGTPWDYADAGGVTRRLFMALHGRPRLRPRPEDAGAIEDVLRQVQPRVRSLAPDILEPLLDADA